MQDYLSLNRHAWNTRTAAHWDSNFYNVPGWLAGADSLRDIELALLPDDLTGLKILHLQCHFGLDTLSLARRGAVVTGVDLSDAAIARANELAERAELTGRTRFINCDLYSLPDHLDEATSFDIVFTTYGTIGWLPDLDRWAGIIANYLRPGGTLVFADFHPVVWMLNDERTALHYRYFKDEPIIEEHQDSYTDNSTGIQYTDVAWNHSFGEILGSLLAAGLRLDFFEEYDYSPYNCFPNMQEIGRHRYQFKELPRIVPITYAIRAIT